MMMLYILFLIIHCLVQDGSTITVLLTRNPETCVYGQSYIRDTHNVPKLVYDEDLRNGAEDWAIRCALKSAMEHSRGDYGENLYMSTGNSVSCANPLYSWYSGVKNYDYDKPQWTMQDGTFLQIVYSTESKFAVATASYAERIYVVGRYDKPIYRSGPFDLKHVPKPTRDVSEDDLEPSPKPSPQIIEVPIPEKDGWTGWVQTSKTFGKCGVNSAVEERWCVFMKGAVSCEGPRKRNVSYTDNC